MKIRLAVFALLPLVACGPLGPIPGGRLSGAAGPSEVASWDAAADVENAQLETRPSDPYSVNTWFAALGSELYVPTSMILGPKRPTKRSWVAHVAEDPRVRIRLGREVYERVAVRVTDAGEYDRARAALEGKYGIEPEDRDPEREIWIFRLDPRSE